MAKAKKKLTGKSTLGEVMKVEGSQVVLSTHNVPCLTCPMAQMEMGTLTLEQICNQYGIDLKKLLQDLNKL